MKIYIVIANGYNDRGEFIQTHYASTIKKQVESKSEFYLNWGYDNIEKYSIETSYPEWKKGWD